MLAKLQASLQQVYEIELECSVDEYLITDAATAAHYDGSAEPREIQEKLLVRQTDDELHLSLYLDSAVMSRLNATDPSQHLHAANINDFMLAVEGVSHFVYVAWNAHFDRCFSLLELELQAEVDKFVLSSWLFEQQSSGSLDALHHCLFTAPKFDSRLSASELQRYRDASHYAGKFCRHIHRRYARGRFTRACMADLRRFYRLPNIEKIAYINRLPN